MLHTPMNQLAWWEFLLAIALALGLFGLMYLLAAWQPRVTRPTGRRPTALLIPSPWSGDEHDPVPWTYPVWFQLYRRSRQVRHLVGLHDRDKPWKRCTWCGKP